MLLCFVLCEEIVCLRTSNDCGFSSRFSFSNSARSASSRYGGGCTPLESPLALLAASSLVGRDVEKGEVEVIWYRDRGGRRGRRDIGLVVGMTRDGPDRSSLGIDVIRCIVRERKNRDTMIV